MVLKPSSKKLPKIWLYLIVIVAGLVLIKAGFKKFQEFKELKEKAVVEEEFNVTQGLEEVKIEKGEEILKNPVFLSLKQYVSKLSPGPLGKENPFK